MREQGRLPVEDRIAIQDLIARYAWAADDAQAPRLRCKAVPASGGDYALFRPDGVLAFDARYLLQEDDGTLILLHGNLVRYYAVL